MKFSLVWAGGLLLVSSSSSSVSSFQPQQTYPASTTNVLSISATTTKLSAVVNIDERAERNLWAMEEWAANCGVQRADGLQLTSTDGVDYSVVTAQDLPAGSPVLFVPAGMVLSAVQVGQELGPSLQGAEDQLAQAGLADQVPLFRLFAKILAEYEQGDQSPFFPWLNAMPRLYNNGASMTCEREQDIYTDVNYA